MTQPVALSNRSQVALQSYLDDLLFDATQALELAEPAPPELEQPATDEAPLAMPSAMARGRATMATVRPAMASSRRRVML